MVFTFGNCHDNRLVTGFTGHRTTRGRAVYGLTGSIQAKFYKLMKISAKTELNGKFFVVDSSMLILLWHEDLCKTGYCYSTIESKIRDRAQEAM
jgi:hypothetical protein